MNNNRTQFTNDKTIFITVSRGFLVRNILRSGVLDRLKDAGLKIVILFSGKEGEPVPKYLQKEFADENVTLEAVPYIHIRGSGTFARLRTYLTYSAARWCYSQIGNTRNLNRHPVWKYLELPVFFIAGHLHFLKTIARFIERTVFSRDVYASYFEKYKPDIVFSASVLSRLDVDFMNGAKRRNIPTVAMPKGWDNITKILYPVIPDTLIVQDEPMKEGANHIQRIPKDNIMITGFPQFDWYRRPEVLVSRQEFCGRYGLDPNKKIIFFGSEGRWAPDDEYIISLLAKWADTKDIFAKDSQLFIRPHFTDAHTGRFKKFKGIKNVVVDDNVTISDFFGDRWDPGVEETKLFTNLIYHCDVLITVASTLTLDGVCFDKPLINVAFEVFRHPKTKKDMSAVLYTEDCYYWVLDTGAVDFIVSEEELKKSINAYLLDPARKRKEREQLLNKLCYKVDGRSSERIANILIKIANIDTNTPMITNGTNRH